MSSVSAVIRKSRCEPRAKRAEGVGQINQSICRSTRPPAQRDDWRRTWPGSRAPCRTGGHGDAGVLSAASRSGETRRNRRPHCAGIEPGDGCHRTGPGGGRLGKTETARGVTPRAVDLCLPWSGPRFSRRRSLFFPVFAIYQVPAASIAVHPAPLTCSGRLLGRDLLAALRKRFGRLLPLGQTLVDLAARLVLARFISSTPGFGWRAV